MFRGTDILQRQTNASDCAMVSIVAARERYKRIHPNVPANKLVIYVTTQTHSLGLKCGRVLGLPVHPIPVRAEGNYSLGGQGLREVIGKDRAEGKHPFIISEISRFTHTPELKSLSQLGLWEPHRVAQLTMSTGSARPVSVSDLLVPFFY